MTMNELLIVLQIAENLDICVGKSGKWVELKYLLELFGRILDPVKPDLLHKKNLEGFSWWW